MRKIHCNTGLRLASIFENIDMINTFHQHQACDLERAKNNIWELVLSDWRAELETKPKLHLYKKHKSDFRPAIYLNFYVPKHQRSLMAQLRCGTLPLRIETGRFNLTRDSNSNRYRSLAVEERLCQVCNNSSVENEINFLCVCPFYSQDRNKLFELATNVIPYFQNLPVEEKFCNLMKYTQKET